MHTCSESEMDEERRYVCGQCRAIFNTICSLHGHLEKDHQGASYSYCHSSKTAYPRFVSVCRDTQTYFEDFIDLAFAAFTNAGPSGEDVSGGAETRDNDTTDKYVSLNENEETVDDVASKNKSLDLQEFTNISDTTEIDCKSKLTNVALVSGSEKRNKTLEKRKKGKLNEKILKRQIHKFKAEFHRNHIEPIDKTRTRNEQPGPAMLCLKPNIDQQSADLFNCSEAFDESENFIISKDANDTNLFYEKGHLYKAPKSNIKTLKTDSVLKCNYKCDVCKTSYNSKIRLEFHYRKVHRTNQNDDDTQRCRWCGKTFPNVSSFKAHSRQCKRNTNRTCFICQKIFDSSTAVMEHLVIHSNGKELSCKICNKNFNHVATLQTHLKKHSLPKDIQCEFCGKAFSFSNTLRKHLLYCNKDKDIQCKECDKKFKTPEALGNHMSIHSNYRPYVCHFCGFAAKKSMYLARHIRSHTGEKPYKCSTCGQAFAAPTGLNRHKKIHSNHRPCVCSYCGKEFTTNWNLKTHIRQHTLETPYKCELCNKAFKQNVLLKHHNKKQHPEKIFC